MLCVVLGGWWSPALGEGSSLPWLVVRVGELAVAVCGDSAAGVAVAAGAAGVGQVAQGLVAPLADGHRGSLSVSLRDSVTELAGFVTGLVRGGSAGVGEGSLAGVAGAGHDREQGLQLA
jgi:hypothetical protein